MPGHIYEVLIYLTCLEEYDISSEVFYTKGTLTLNRSIEYNDFKRLT